MAAKSLISILLIAQFSFLISGARAQTSSDWYMAGANPARTSWVSSGIIPNPDNLTWWKTFSAFIPHKVQIVGPET